MSTTLAHLVNAKLQHVCPALQIDVLAADSISMYDSVQMKERASPGCHFE